MRAFSGKLHPPVAARTGDRLGTHTPSPPRLLRIHRRTLQTAIHNDSSYIPARPGQRYSAGPTASFSRLLPRLLIRHPHPSRCKPTQNALIESFNGKFRDECLNQNWFVDLRDAREVIDAWRVDHNTVHPHSSVRYLTPEEFAESVAARPASPSTPVVSIDPAWAGSDVQEPRSANL